MAPSSRSPSAAHQRRDAFPTFDLTYRYDSENPSELTVLPESATVDRTTAWLTIGVEHAVPLDAIR